jgi:hypothetical protein
VVIGNDYILYYESGSFEEGSMPAELQGQIERITFTNEENGFTIARVKVPGRHDLVCAVGNLMAPMPGEVIDCRDDQNQVRR